MSSQQPDDVPSLWKQWLGLDSHQYCGAVVGSSPIPTGDTMVRSSLFCTNQAGRLQNPTAASFFFMIKLELQKMFCTIFFCLKPDLISNGKTCSANYGFVFVTTNSSQIGNKK